MADLPEQPAYWGPIPQIQPGDKVLGGEQGPANKQALAIMGRAQAVLEAAQAAALTATNAAVAASAAATTAETAATAATNAATAAQAAHDVATTAETAATAALNTARARAVRVDLGTVNLTFTAPVILGAGTRSITVACPLAQVGDAIFASPTAAVPDGYGTGGAQCLTAGQIRVSVSYPALALGANFTIPVAVFALRNPPTT